MVANSYAVQQWRTNTKIKMVQSMGGKCQCCGYDRCYQALEFHHLDPSKKDFGFGSVMSHPKAWDKITPELLKCILLCSNCHKEVHYGSLELPEFFQSFDENLITFGKNLNEKEYPDCKMCGKSKDNYSIYCGNVCSGKSRNLHDWDNIDLIKLIERDKIPKTQLAKQFGVSDKAIANNYNKQKEKLEEGGYTRNPNLAVPIAFKASPAT